MTSKVNMRQMARLDAFNPSNCKFDANNLNKSPKHEFIKKTDVDYDVVICIPSHNRYEKLKRIINQFYSQSTRYTFKFIILNDGSIDNRYDTLKKEFPDITYLKNEVSNGKAMHWYCYNQMWKYLKPIYCHAILQTDDDFIFSDNFLNNIMDLYFEKKKNNDLYMGIGLHLWSLNENSVMESWWDNTEIIDGIALLDPEIIQYMDYRMHNIIGVDLNQTGMPVKTWVQISNAVKEFGGCFYKTENSLVYHDGNDDSQLHGDYRKNNEHYLYTRKYIGKI